MSPPIDPPAELLTVAEMRRADAFAIAAGTPGRLLMERAGAAVAAAAREAAPEARRAAVLCGPGANGGDGFVAARLLAQAGLDVRLYLAGDRGALAGDAGLAAADFAGEAVALERLDLADIDLVVDALFGAGLSRDLDGPALAAVRAVAAWRRGGAARRVVAVDTPSGVDGDSGAARGGAAAADVTVTFFRRKPGHCLLPGRTLCGRIVVADIGIPAAALAGIAPRTSAAGPALWRELWPGPAVDGHKYVRGHCVVTSGGATRTGAARLAARAALRVGAGLVTVAAPRAALTVAAAQLTAIMLAACEGAAALAGLLADRRLNAVVLGPAGGVGKRLETMARAALASPAAVVLDADALTSFAGRADVLAQAIGARANVALTPHDGEFARLFGDIAGDRLTRARAAAERVGAIIVLKGPDTVIAAPDGRAAILDFDAPWLATAGSGDVLAGLIGGLAAQGLPMFQACAAAVWLHAATGRAIGPGLIAEDLPERLPDILRAHFGAGQGMQAPPGCDPTGSEEAPMPQTITTGYKQLLAEANARIETIPVADALSLVGRDDVVLVDLRDPRELEREGRMPGAFHCPRGMLEFWIDPESPYAKPQFQQDKKFVFFCAGGWRSALAAATAARMGLKPVAHIEGGFGAWKKAGGPVEEYHIKHQEPAKG